MCVNNVVPVIINQLVISDRPLFDLLPEPTATPIPILTIYPGLSLVNGYVDDPSLTASEVG